MSETSQTAVSENDGRAAIEGELVEEVSLGEISLAELPAQGPSEESHPLALVHSVPLDEHPVAVYLAGLAVRSRRTMRGDLETIARLLSGGRCDAFTLSWSALRFQHVQALRSALAERYAHTTANRMLCAMRGVLKAAWNLGQMPTEEYHRARSVTSVRGESLPRGRHIASGELRALFQACASDRGKDGQMRPLARRDAALLGLAYGVGLRRSEIVSLDRSDYEEETGALKVRAGKGNKARMVYASGGAKVMLETWLRLRGDGEGPLFYPLTKSGSLASRRLNSQAVMDVLLRRAQEAGLQSVSPHDFRRTFISDLLDAGADIVTVQKLAGHASVSTTARYDRRGEAVKQRAVGMLHIPVID
jgi:site-specific recombinase XerD